MKQLTQIIGPRACGKTKLIEAFSERIVYVNRLFINTVWNNFLDVPGRPTYLIDVPFDIRFFDKLRELVISEFITIYKPMELSYQIPNNGIWVYEGHVPLKFQPSLIWEIKC